MLPCLNVVTPTEIQEAMKGRRRGKEVEKEVEGYNMKDQISIIS